MANQVTRDELLQSNSVQQMIAERAYFISEQQGFAPGREEEHWFTAEAQTIEVLLSENGVQTAETVAASVVAPMEKKTRSRKAAPKAEATTEASAEVKTEGATPRRTTRKKSS